MASVIIYIDGACLPSNPGGYATWAYVVIDGNGKEIGLNYGCVGHGEEMTNNIAEYHALINAIKRAKKENWQGCIIKSDSQLVVYQTIGMWRCKSGSLTSLWQEAIALYRSFPCKIEWIPREQNKRADHLTEIAYKKKRSQS